MYTQSNFQDQETKLLSEVIVRKVQLPLRRLVQSEFVLKGIKLNIFIVVLGLIIPRLTPFYGITLQDSILDLPRVRVQLALDQLQ